MTRRTRKSRKKASPKAKKAAEVHPWRTCPYGEHWVVTHPLHVPPSKKDPDGGITTRHGHCAHNPSRKDQLYTDEIRKIAQDHFTGVKNRPCPLPLKYQNGSKVDDLIAGWTQYWNDVLQPKDPPKGPHVHLDGDLDGESFRWKSLEASYELFFERVRDRFGEFEIAEEK